MCADRTQQLNRGTIWTEKETNAFLDVWGEPEIQHELKTHFRNTAVYAHIANELTLQGFNRTATECRNKAKALRSTYRDVVAHNGLSGTGKMAPTYFARLHQILSPDSSEVPPRVGRSVKVEVEEPPPGQQQPTSGSIYSQLHTLDARAIQDQQDCRSDQGELVSQSLLDDDEVTQIKLENIPVEILMEETDYGTDQEATTSSTPARKRSRSSDCGADCERVQTSPRDISPARMTPRTRIRRARGRNIRGRRGESIAVAIMQQQQEEAEALEEATQRRHEDIVRILEIQNQRSSEERRAILDTIKSLTASMLSMMDRMITVQALAAGVQEPGPPQSPNINDVSPCGSPAIYVVGGTQPRQAAPNTGGGRHSLVGMTQEHSMQSSNGPRQNINAYSGAENFVAGPARADPSRHLFSEAMGQPSTRPREKRNIKMRKVFSP